MGRVFVNIEGIWYELEAFYANRYNCIKKSDCDQKNK